MIDLPVDPASEHEALIQFLYLAPVGLAQCTLDGGIVMANPFASQLLMPLSRDGGLDNLFETLSGAAPDLRQRVAGFEPSHGVVCKGLRIRLPACSSAAPVPQVLSLTLLKLDPQRLMAMLADATADSQREQQQLHRAARTDSLTRMPNREALVEHVQQAIQRHRHDAGRQFAVLFMNCDRFKQINDSLGHAAGDEVLGYMAGRLQAALRLRDDGSRHGGLQPMAARIGSDEFAVVLDNVRGADDTHGVAQRLLDSLAQPYGVGPTPVHCTVSMGVVVWSRDACGHGAGDADTMLQDASIAMVEAKRAGGCRYVVFEPIMHERAANRAGVESDLRRAIAGDELFLVYQPVIDLARGHVASAEALVRWRHPLRGIVPPLDFIGVAEETGLIGALGDFVLNAACRQFMQWRKYHGDNAPRTIAVNLSRAQLSMPGLVGEVEAALAASGIDPARLQLEVTESHAARDDEVRLRLHELKALGVTIALDDFGTGYSSLSSLQMLPIDTVKIDRSFVCQAHDSAHHRVLIEATIRVARSLGMNTVAEGIETQAQADVLRELACDKGQGYLFAKPLEAEAFERWLRAHEAQMPVRPPEHISV